MTGFDLPAPFSYLIRNLKMNVYDNMNRIARDWSPEGTLMPKQLTPIREAGLLSFSSRSRKRLRQVRRICGHSH